MQRFDIKVEDDIVRARTAARDFATELDFSIMDKTRIATAVSELARNTLVHGGGGCVEIDEAVNGERSGIRCVFDDQGPGMADIAQALTAGFSTSRSMGQGLPGAKRLVDDLRIDSTLGAGTRVEIVKWK